MALEPVAAEGRTAGGGAIGVSSVSAGEGIADLVDNDVVVNEVIEFQVGESERCFRR